MGLTEIEPGGATTTRIATPVSNLGLPTRNVEWLSSFAILYSTATKARHLWCDSSNRTESHSRAPNTWLQTQITNHNPKNDNIDTEERQACSIDAW